MVLPNVEQAAHAAVNVTTASTTANAATGDASQKTCVSNGYYWMAYSDGTNGQILSSPDGSTWTVQQNAGAATAGNGIVMICEPGTNTIAYVRTPSAAGTIYTRWGTASNTGTVSWGIGESSDATGSDPTTLSADFDSSGNIWVTGRNGVTAKCDVFEYSVGGASWTNTVGFPTAIGAGGCGITALTGGKMAIVQDAYTTADDLGVYTWSGAAWSSPVGVATSGATGMQINTAMTHVGNTVEVINGNQYMNFTYGAASWSTPVTYTADTSSGVGEIISTDGTKLVVVYELFVGSGYTVKVTTLASTVTLGTWSTPRFIANNEGQTMEGMGGGPYLGSGGNSVVLWTTGSSPYTVRAQVVVPIGPIVQYVTNTLSGTSITCVFGAVTANDILAVGATAAGSNGITNLGVADSIGNSWTSSAVQIDAATTAASRGFYTKSGAGASDTITVTLTAGGADNLGIVCYELNGLVTGGAVFIVAIGTGASVAVGSFTAPAGSFVMAVAGASNSANTMGAISWSASYVGAFTLTSSTAYGNVGQHVVSASGSASTAPFSIAGANPGSNGWGEVALYLQPPIVQPIRVTMQNSAPAATVTITGAGCSLNATTFSSDGNTHNFAMVNGCSFTLGFTNSGNIRDGFNVASAFSATSANQTASGSLISLTAYQQDNDGFYYTIQRGGSGFTAPTLTYYSASNSQTLLLTTSSQSVWVDYGSSWTSTNPLTGSSSDERWNSNSASGTISAITVTNIPYYNQYQATLDYALSGGGAPGAPTLTGTQYGASYTPTLTTGAIGYWLDGGSSCSVTNPLSSSGSTHRWETGQACNSGNPITAQFTTVFTYYNQYGPNISYQLIGAGSFNAPMLDCSQFGSPYTPTLTISATQYWCDSGQAWSSTNGLTGASSGPNEQAYSTAASGTISSASAIVVTYYHQYQIPFKWTANGGTPNTNPTLTFVQYGSPDTLSLTHALQPTWLDAGTSWSVPNPWLSNMQEFSPSPASGSAKNGNGNTVNILYTPQNQNCATTTVITTTTTSASTVTITSTITNTTPYSLAQQGCIAPAIYYEWYQILGPFFVAFIDFLAALGTYIGTESPGLATAVYEVINVVLLAVVPVPNLILTAPILMMAGLLAGAIFQVYRSGKGG